MRRARDHEHTNRQSLDECRRSATTLGEATWRNSQTIRGVPRARERAYLDSEHTCNGLFGAAMAPGPTAMPQSPLDRPDFGEREWVYEHRNRRYQPPR